LKKTVQVTWSVGVGAIITPNNQQQACELSTTQANQALHCLFSSGKIRPTQGQRKMQDSIERVG
jgi:hypothetical protein